MKTWKIVGITGLLLAGLLFSGAAQARRFDNHSYYNRCGNTKNYSNNGYHHQPRWAAAREHEGFRHERERHHGWEQGNHNGWERHNRMAARNSYWW
jgi:hypothetical protein